ncbi:MAG TPA: YceI family protein [Vicinamibacterales bacterium]|nr:YceI family protein [Vicinamibacterales bacterium]
MDGDEVLAIERYRELTFESTSVAGKGGDGDAMDLLVDGRLVIRGVAQAVHVAVHVVFGANVLTATGRFTVKQSTFGIKPITVAGVVAVKDALEIRFSIVAVRSS